MKLEPAVLALRTNVMTCGFERRCLSYLKQVVDLNLIVFRVGMVTQEWANGSFFISTKNIWGVTELEPPKMKCTGERTMMDLIGHLVYFDLSRIFVSTTPKFYNEKKDKSLRQQTYFS